VSILKTLILFLGDKEPVSVKESYLTIRRRLFEEGLFFEVTVEGKKMIFNKTQVIAVRTAELRKPNDKLQKTSKKN